MVLKSVFILISDCLKYVFCVFVHFVCFDIAKTKYENLSFNLVPNKPYFLI